MSKSHPPSGPRPSGPSHAPKRLPSKRGKRLPMAEMHLPIPVYEIDEMSLDILVPDGPLGCGRPILSVLTDRQTRSILSFSLRRPEGEH